MGQTETSVDKTGNLSGKSTLKICSQTHVDTPRGGGGEEMGGGGGVTLLHLLLFMREGGEGVVI